MGPGAWPAAGGVVKAAVRRSSTDLAHDEQLSIRDLHIELPPTLQANSTPPAVQQAEFSPYLRADNFLHSSCSYNSSSCFFSSDSCILELGKIVDRS